MGCRYVGFSLGPSLALGPFSVLAQRAAGAVPTGIPAGGSRTGCAPTGKLSAAWSCFGSADLKTTNHQKHPPLHGIMPLPKGADPCRTPPPPPTSSPTLPATLRPRPSALAS